ncbi:MAG: hypothetical protein REJ23_06140 [Brevundimonas sp.]|nr:hypothetical protein [Brevundimonas sp.]
MKTWVWMLGGLIVWAVHFAGIYAIASVADVVARADALSWRMAALAFSGVCALVCAGLLALAARRIRTGPPPGTFADQMATLGAVLALISIFWQALPTLTGY